jgi:hypothetical protein
VKIRLRNPIFKDKSTQTKEQKAENAVLLAKNAQITSLRKINASLIDELNQLSDFIGKKEKSTVEEKLIDGLMTMFTSPKNMGTVKQPKPLQTTLVDVNASSTADSLDMDEVLSNLPPHLLKSMASAPFDKFSSIAKNQYPQLTDSQLREAHEKIRMMV